MSVVQGSGWLPLSDGKPARAYCEAFSRAIPHRVDLSDVADLWSERNGDREGLCVPVEHREVCVKIVATDTPQITQNSFSSDQIDNVVLQHTQACKSNTHALDDSLPCWLAVHTTARLPLAHFHLCQALRCEWVQDACECLHMS